MGVFFWKKKKYIHTHIPYIQKIYTINTIEQGTYIHTYKCTHNIFIYIHAIQYIHIHIYRTHTHTHIKHTYIPTCHTNKNTPTYPHAIQIIDHESDIVHKWAHRGRYSNLEKPLGIHPYMVINIYIHTYGL